MSYLSSAFTLFFSLVLETAPFLLLGVIISSALLVFVEQNQWQSRFPQNPILGAFLGSGLGLLFPVGQYGIIPIARRFLLQGISLPIVISFLIAAPTINPLVLWLSWKVFSQQGFVHLFYWRVLLTSAIAVIVGCLFTLQLPPLAPKIQDTEDNEDNLDNVDYALVSCAPKPQLKKPSALIYGGSSLLFPLPYQPLQAIGKIIYHQQKQDGSDLPKSLQFKLFGENLSRELLEWGSLLIIGCAIATLMSILLPQGQILSFGTTSRYQIIALSLFGVILSVGTIKSSLFATSLLSTFSSGSILGFLLIGSIFDLKSLTFIFGTFKFKNALYLTIITIQLILVSSLVFDFYLT